MRFYLLIAYITLLAMEMLGLSFAGKVLMVTLKPVLPQDVKWLSRAIIPQQNV